MSSAAPQQGRRVRLPKWGLPAVTNLPPVASTAGLVLALRARLPVLVQSAHSLPYHRCPVASRLRGARQRCWCLPVVSVFKHRSRQLLVVS
jgi:hypothetical protein